MSYAARVASMFRAMYSRSFTARLGLTENCSTASGHAEPTTSAENSRSTVARAGIRRSLMTIAEKKAAAHTSATENMKILAGMTALTSVYPAPVKVEFSRNSNSYRSSQYAAALSSTNSPASPRSWIRAARVSAPSRAPGRSPPKR